MVGKRNTCSNSVRSAWRLAMAGSRQQTVVGAQVDDRSRRQLRQRLLERGHLRSAGVEARYLLGSQQRFDRLLDFDFGGAGGQMQQPQVLAYGRARRFL